MFEFFRTLFTRQIPLNAGDFWRSTRGQAFSLLRNRRDLMKKQIELATESEVFKQGVPKPRGEEAFARAYERVLWVHVAIKAIAETAAMLPIKVMESTTDSQGNVFTQEVTDTNVFAYKVLNQPNTFDTPYEFKLNIFGSYGYSGNSFIFIDPDDVEAFVLKPQDMGILASKSNFIDGYLFRRSGSSKEILIPPERMVHIKSFNPTSYFYGLSPLSAAWSEVEFLQFDSNYWKIFFQEGGRVMGVWSTDNSMSEVEYTRLKEQIKVNYKGARNLFKDIVADGGLKFNQLGVTAKDQQLIDKRKITREEVLAAYSVPPSIAGLLDFANYSNMEVQERLFYTRGIKPMLTLLEEALSKNPILSENGRYHFEFDTSGVAVLQKSKQDMADLGKTLIESSQFTPNEVRQDIWEKEPLDGGAILKPVAPVAPLLGFSNPAPQTAAAEVEATKDMPEFNEIEVPETPQLTNSEREIIAKEFEDRVERTDGDVQKTSRDHFKAQEDVVLDAVRRALEGKGPTGLEASDADTIVASLDATTRQYQSELNVDIGIIMDKFGSLEAASIDRRLRKAGRPVVTKSDDVIVQTIILLKEIFGTKQEAIDWVQENGFKSDDMEETQDAWRFRQIPAVEFTEGTFRTVRVADGVNAITGTLEERTENAYSAKRLLLISKQDEEVVFDFSDPRVAEFAQARSIAVSIEVDLVTQEQLHAVIADQIKQGATVQEISNAIEGYFTTAASTRAKRIAQTETATAANKAIKVTHDQNSDVVEGRVWITARDSNVRDTHRSLDGSFRQLDQTYKIGNATAIQPGSFGVAAEDINCRCTTIAKVQV